MYVEMFGKSQLVMHKRHLKLLSRVQNDSTLFSFASDFFKAIREAFLGIPERAAPDSAVCVEKAQYPGSGGKGS